MTSTITGFLLKLLAALAAAAFGLMGIGTKTRENNGDLNRNGKIALIGIIVAGSLAVGNGYYEFITNQQKEREDRLRSERLMYPLKEITGEVRIGFAQDFAGLRGYKALLRRALPRGKQKCVRTDEFECYDADSEGRTSYGIPETSRLFPEPDSLVGIVLDNLAVDISLVNRGSAGADKSYNRIGEIHFELRAANPKDKMITFDPASGEFEFMVQHFQIPEEQIRRSGVYSLVEVFPGFVAASASVRYRFPCNSLMKGGVPDCVSGVLRPLSDGSTVDELLLNFPSSKALRIERDESINCVLKDGGSVLILTLPEDIEQIDQFGNLRVLTRPDNYRTSICAAFNNPGF
jgi:hypothetical protein